LSNSDADFADRFLKRARSARLLKHPNVVRIHDAGEVGGSVYVAMEMLDGRSLRNILDDGPLPVARSMRIAHDIACALAHAHLEGVVHGAIKPSNVIVLRSGVVKVTDFGIGQAALVSTAQVGCLSYMSPEQVRGEAVDHRCDLFSLGALFYEMLTRRPPFDGGSPKAIMENMLHAKLPLPSDLNPHVPRALDAIVLGMLARQPADRMPGAPILIRDLQPLEEGLGLGSGASAGTGEPTANVPPARPEPAPRTQQPSRLTDGEAFDHHKAIAIMERESRRSRFFEQRPAIFAAALALAVVGIGGVGGYMYYLSDPSQRDIGVSRRQEAPATLPVAQAESLVGRASEQTTEPRVAAPRMPEAPATAPAVSDPTEFLPVAEAAKEPPPAVHDWQAEPQELAPPREPPAKVAEPQPGGTAQVIVAVSPRGEVYIDGKHRGTTPPVTTFDLEPGMHRIEVRSGSQKPYLTYMAVQAGDVRRIRHDFNVSRAVPPARSAAWQSGHRPAR
jgi:serine/threonine-protein kinase